MQFLLIPVLGLAPGLLWLWLIYRGNKNRPEPKGLVIRTFIFGAIATIPVSIIETVLILPYIFAHIQDLQSYAISGFNNMSFAQTAYMSFIVAGFTEELSKFLVVRTTIYKSPYYDEPIDGSGVFLGSGAGFCLVGKHRIPAFLRLANGADPGPDYHAGARNVFRIVGLSAGAEKAQEEKFHAIALAGVIGSYGRARIIRFSGIPAKRHAEKYTHFDCADCFVRGPYRLLYLFDKTGAKNLAV